MNDWFEKEFSRLSKIDKKQDWIFIKINPTDSEGIEELSKFSEKLAVTLFKAFNLFEDSKKSKCIDYSNKVNSSCQKFFKENQKTRLFRKSAPLKCISEKQFNFIHKSIMDILSLLISLKSLNLLTLNIIKI